jgi:hypothetical protein
MKGIYLTEEAKQEIEAKIALYKRLQYKSAIHTGELNQLKEILSTATILPVENGYNEFYYNLNEYPQGVIIKPKQ